MIGRVANNTNQIDKYKSLRQKKMLVIILLAILAAIVSIISINVGASEISFYQVICTIFGFGNEMSRLIVWQIRVPRVLVAVMGGLGLATAGCVMQNNLQNPLASPSTLGISNAAAFGANMAIVVFGAGSIKGTGASLVAINNPYSVTLSAFIWAMFAAVVILFLAKLGSFSPEAMILAGVAISSLFSAGTILIQYFARDVQVAAAVFWTFGDLGRVVWSEIAIMSIVVVIGVMYYLFRRWDYNALDSGEESAKSLGVNVGKVRFGGMLISSLITAILVSFLGVIGFIGLIAPQIMRRILGGDHRYLIAASGLAGALLLLISDILARVIISPIVLPIGAVTSFFGAPLFLYLLVGRYKAR